MMYNIQRDCWRRSCVLSSSRRTQSKTRHRRCCQRSPAEKASKGHQTQQHASKHVDMPSGLCVQRLSVWRLWTPSSKTDPNSQKRLRHTSWGISWVAASRSWGTRAASLGTQTKKTQRTCSEVHMNPQTDQWGTLRNQQHSEVAQEQQQHHDWLFHCTCLVQSQTLHGTCLRPTSNGKQECPLTPPRTPHWTGHTNSPSSQHATRFMGTFHSGKLTSNKTSVMTMLNKYVIFG